MILILHFPLHYYFYCYLYSRLITIVTKIHYCFKLIFNLSHIVSNIRLHCSLLLLLKWVFGVIVALYHIHLILKDLFSKMYEYQIKGLLISTITVITKPNYLNYCLNYLLQTIHFYYC